MAEKMETDKERRLVKALRAMKMKVDGLVIVLDEARVALQTLADENNALWKAVKAARIDVPELGHKAPEVKPRFKVSRYEGPPLKVKRSEPAKATSEPAPDTTTDTTVIERELERLRAKYPTAGLGWRIPNETDEKGLPYKPLVEWNSDIVWLGDSCGTKQLEQAILAAGHKPVDETAPTEPTPEEALRQNMEHLKRLAIRYPTAHLKGGGKPGAFKFGYALSDGERFDGPGFSGLFNWDVVEAVLRLNGHKPIDVETGKAKPIAGYDRETIRKGLYEAFGIPASDINGFLPKTLDDAILIDADGTLYRHGTESTETTDVEPSWASTIGITAAVSGLVGLFRKREKKAEVEAETQPSEAERGQPALETVAVETQQIKCEVNK